MSGAETAVVAQRTPAFVAILRDYVTLTKPKVQSLLLLTTITTMYVAGDPSPGRISPQAAITFGVALGCASFALLSLAVIPLAAALSLSSLLGYVFFYTLWLKR